MPYCVNTSGWLDGWQRHYPPDVFPSLWSKLDELIKNGEIISSEEVYIELERKSDELHDWVKARKHMLVPIEEHIQARAMALLAEFPRLLDTLRNRSKRDCCDRGAIYRKNGQATNPRRLPGQKHPLHFVLEMIRELKFTF